MNENYCDYEEMCNLSKNNKNPIWLVKKGNDLAVKRQVGGDEAKIYMEIMKISNSYLPKIYSVTDIGGDSYVFEQYIEGKRLDTYENGYFSENDARNIIFQLCTALQSLHEKRIIHRDIKPENIIVSDGKVYLIDFNIARIYKDNNTSDTEYLGTAGYAAPEQFGFGQSDERSDIYSLGILYNELLTGNISNQQLYGGEAGRIIEKCTQIAPEKRYQSIQELKEDLMGISDEVKSQIKEKIADKVYFRHCICSALQVWTVQAFISSYIHNCVDSKWALGFDFFCQTAKEYLGENHSISSVMNFINAVPLTAWLKMAAVFVLLIVFAQNLKKYSAFSGISLIAFFVYDLRWQARGFMGGYSIYAANSPIIWQDILNVALHMLIVGVLIRILYDKRSINLLCDRYKRIT